MGRLTKALIFIAEDQGLVAGGGYGLLFAVLLGVDLAGVGHMLGGVVDGRAGVVRGVLVALGGFLRYGIRLLGYPSGRA